MHDTTPFSHCHHVWSNRPTCFHFFFLPGGSSTSFNVWFLCKASTSSYIVVIHKDDCLFLIKLIVFTFFISVLSPYSLCSMFSTTMASLLMLTLWVVGSHRRYPFTLSAYPKNMHFLDFRSSFVLFVSVYITQTGHLNMYKEE